MGWYASASQGIVRLELAALSHCMPECNGHFT